MAATSKSKSNETTPEADQQPPSELATIGLSLLGTFVAARCLAVVSRLATVLAAPAMGFYLFTTCPTNASFDGKKELKRVLRGDKLPNDHPAKPQVGILSRFRCIVRCTRHEPTLICHFIVDVFLISKGILSTGYGKSQRVDRG